MTANSPADSPADFSATGPLADATGVLDPQALAGLTQLDPTGANRLVPRVLSTYSTSLARLLQQLVQARHDGDMAAVKLAAHTLKSSSASVGALVLSALCAEAEQVVRDGRTAELPAVLDHLQAEAARVDTAVRLLLTDR